jgi:hypothetical protein
LTESQLSGYRPDSKLAQKKYIDHLMEVGVVWNGRDGFTQVTSSGIKISREMFWDAKKVSSEAVQRVIIMLLVHFGLMSKHEIRNGLLPEDYRSVEGKTGTSPPLTNFTIDRLHQKLLEVFGDSPNLLSKYYDPAILFCPELSLKKTRIALTYFTQFCMFYNHNKNEMDANISEATQRRRRNAALRSNNGTLRLQIQEQEELAEKLEAELQQKESKYEAEIKEEARTLQINNELNIKIKEAENEFQGLKVAKELEVAKLKKAIATTSKSKDSSTSLLVVSKKSVEVRPPSTRAKSEGGHRSCTNYKCKETEAAAAATAAELAKIKGNKLGCEQILHQTKKLRDRLQKLESNLNTEKVRKEEQDLHLSKAKELLVKAKMLEHDIKTDCIQHKANMEAMRSKFVVKELVLSREMERSRQLDKKLADARNQAASSRQAKAGDSKLGDISENDNNDAN